MNDHIEPLTSALDQDPMWQDAMAYYAKKKAGKSPFTEQDYLKDPVFQRMQWEVRSAYETGYYASGVNRGLSEVNPNKGKWFDHWINSKSRAFLIANNLMTGEETYK